MSSASMDTAKICRLCACTVKDTGSNNLFDKSNEFVIKQIGSLTGLTIKDMPRQKLPRFICPECKEYLPRAYEYRLKIIKTQAYFKSKEYKSTLERVEKDLKPAFDFVQLNEYDMNETKSSSDDSDEQKFDDVAAEFAEVVIKNEIKEPKPQYAEDEDVNSSKAKDTKNHKKSLNDKFYENSDLVDTEENNFSFKLEQTDVSTKKENEISAPNDLIASIDFMESTFDNNANDDFSTNDSQSDSSENPEDPDFVVKLPNKTPKKEHRCNSIKEKDEPNDVLKNRQFSCHLCKLPLESLISLKIHFRKQHKGEKIKCDLCENKFSTTKSLVRHFRIHQGEKPVKCSFCEMSFKYASTRVRHERRYHSKDSPFLCFICGKTFITSYMGKDHMVVHTKERAFHCNVCKADFLRKAHLVTHYRSVTHKNNEQKFNEGLSKINANDSQQYLGVNI